MILTKVELYKIFNLISDAFKSLGKGKQVTEDDVKNFVQAIDKNSDGKISKE